MTWSPPRTCAPPSIATPSQRVGRRAERSSAAAGAGSAASPRRRNGRRGPSPTAGRRRSRGALDGHRGVGRDVLGDLVDVERFVADHGQMHDGRRGPPSCSTSSTSRSRRTAAAPGDDGSCRWTMTMSAALASNAPGCGPPAVCGRHRPAPSAGDAVSIGSMLIDRLGDGDRAASRDRTGAAMKRSPELRPVHDRLDVTPRGSIAPSIIDAGSTAPRSSRAKETAACPATPASEPPDGSASSTTTSSVDRPRRGECDRSRRRGSHRSSAMMRHDAGLSPRSPRRPRRRSRRRSAR